MGASGGDFKEGYPVKVHVKVDSNLRIPNVFEPPFMVELDQEGATLRDVLHKLSDMYPYLKFMERGEMGDDVRYVYLNGKSHFSFPEGLNREISEGETVLVEAYMDPLAGG
jgi:hypothetical protein